MSGTIRLFSPQDAGSFSGVERRKAVRLTASFLPAKINFGGTVASFGLQSVHQFFGQEGKSNPHHVISQQLARHKASMGEDNLMRTQKNVDLRKTQNPKPADYVAEAAKWADELTKSAEETHGSKDAALEAVARKTGVNHSTLWSLRYRKPKDIAVSIYMKLKGAYERELVRQEGLLRHEQEIRRSAHGDADRLVIAADAILAALANQKGE